MKGDSNLENKISLKDLFRFMLFEAYFLLREHESILKDIFFDKLFESASEKLIRKKINVSAEVLTFFRYPLVWKAIGGINGTSFIEHVPTERYWDPTLMDPPIKLKGSYSQEQLEKFFETYWADPAFRGQLECRFHKENIEGILI
ncbi:MAG: hypothetical protein ABH804_02825 [archaeon]